ncbi:MAG: endonuclease NucS domain-containing protein [Kiloniellaceae bacterium]
MDEDAGAEPTVTEPIGDQAFAAEAHLRDFLVGPQENLEAIEPGLRLFVDDDGRDGVEYPTPVGNIDILAEDRDGGLVIIELKVRRGPDAVVGQILRYKGWVKRHLAGGRPVRGIIIAQHISDRVRYASAEAGELELKEYSLSIMVTPVLEFDE